MNALNLQHILEIRVAKSAGTCFGVEAAIELAERHQKPVLGPLVHNPQIVRDLSQKGIPILERYEDLHHLKQNGYNEVVLTAHGYPKELKKSLEEQGVHYYDATCPVLLKWVYAKIQQFEAQSYQVILIGNPKHAEIIASRTYGANVAVVYSQEDIDLLPNFKKPVAALCQTTITLEKLQGLLACLRRRFPGLVSVDTRCKPVKNQQEAIVNLAQCMDAMIIIGGYNSSNTTNLAKIAKRYLPKTSFHIDSPEKVKSEWLRGIQRLGVGAGTSTPKKQIEELLNCIIQLYPGPVHIHAES